MRSGKEEKSVVTFNGIADRKYKCTPDELCRRCQPHPVGPYATHFEREPERFRGKFKESFAEAVRENNLEFIRAKGEEK
jgi:hypothetical protein